MTPPEYDFSDTDPHVSRAAIVVGCILSGAVGVAVWVLFH